jgi:hypothetical protein
LLDVAKPSNSRYKIILLSKNTMEYLTISRPFGNDIFPTSGRLYYVQKSWRKIQARQVPRMRDKRNPYRILVGNPAGKNHVQDLGEDGKEI